MANYFFYKKDNKTQYEKKMSIKLFYFIKLIMRYNTKKSN